MDKTLHEVISEWYDKNTEFLEPETLEFFDELITKVKSVETTIDIEALKREHEENIAKLERQYDRDTSGLQDEVTSYKQSYVDLKYEEEKLLNDIEYEFDKLKQLFIDEFLYEMEDINKKTYIDSKIKLFEDNINNYIWKHRSNDYHF